MDISTLEPQVKLRQPVESLTLPELFNSVASFSNSIAASISLRFGGFTPSLEALIDPLTIPIPQRLAAEFFSQKLPEVVALAEKNPAAAHRIISTKMNNSPHLWRDLLLLACGDGSALAKSLDAVESAIRTNPASTTECIISVAKQRPVEGRHLIAHAFASSDINAQLYMLSRIVNEENVGSMPFLGDLFVKLMEGSTAIEREETIYPALRTILSAGPLKSPRLGFLDALLRGWLSECNVK